MRFSKLFIPLTFVLSFSAPVQSSAPLNLPKLNLHLNGAIRVAANTLTLRSVSFITAKLAQRGFVVSDARRQGQIYVFRTSKQGFMQLIAVDARDAKIVGLNVLAAPAGAQLPESENKDNHFIDETYEFGYVVSEKEYESFTPFTPAHMSATEDYTVTAVEESEMVIYEPLDVVADGSDDLDKADEGTAQDDTAVPAEPSAEKPAAECPSGGNGTEGCPTEPDEDAVPPEPGVDEPDLEEPLLDEPALDEPPPEEPPQ